MAAAIKRELGLETELIVGNPGEFTVWVGDQMVIKKGFFGFPNEEKVVAAVREAFH